jgi:hypothetical protein
VSLRRHLSVGFRAFYLRANLEQSPRRRSFAKYPREFVPFFGEFRRLRRDDDYQVLVAWPFYPLSNCISVPSRLLLRAAGSAPTRIALHTRPIPHQGKIPALAAHLAFVAFGLRFGAAFGFGGGLFARGAGFAPLQGFELFRRREVVARFLLQRDGAFDGVGDAAVGGEGGDVGAAARLCPTPARFACRHSPCRGG